MSKVNVRFWFGAVLLLIGAAIVIVYKIKSIDLTEGRALITYWYAWTTAIVIYIPGLWCVIGSDD